MQIREDSSFGLAIVSNTHSTPHFRTKEIITGLQPDAILHAGDIGDLHVLDQLKKICVNCNEEYSHLLAWPYRP